MNNAQIRSALVQGIGRVFMPGALPVTLHDYQRETLEATARWLLRLGSPSRAYVAQATGLGKTIEEAAIVAACEGLGVLIIVPNKIMVTQFMRDLVGFTEGTIAHASSLKDIVDTEGEVIATHWKGQWHDVLVATDETFKTKFGLIKSELNPQVIIWDECHWSYTEKAQGALAAFPEAIVIGFSATPDYLTTSAKSGYTPVTLDNGQVLYGPSDKFARTYYPELLDERTARWGIQHGRLASLAWGQLDFALNLDDIPVFDGPGGMDFDKAELQRVMRKNWPFIVQVIRKLYQSGQYELASRFAAAVCPGVSEAEELAEELRGIGITAKAITQKTKDKDRDAILEMGRRGDLQFLSSVFVLREGWNSPNAEVAMMLRPTKSRVLYVQFMGRVLRLFGDKVALVLDPHYQNTRFAPLSAPVLFGTAGQVVYSGDILVGGTRGGAAVISPYLLERLEPVLTVQPLQIEYWAGEDGTFQADGETWGTVKPLANILQLSYTPVLARVALCRQRAGKDGGGHTLAFYALSDMRRACADLLQGVSEAGEEGTFQADGETWGTASALARILTLDSGTVRDRIPLCSKREGKCAGQPCIFYSLSDMRRACAKLLKDVPKAGKSGMFEADDETWGMLRALARVLKISKPTLKRRSVSCNKREGKDVTGRPQVFYSLSDMRRACADLLKEAPAAEDNGSPEADEETWATAPQLARILTFGKSAIKSRLHLCRQREGKDSGGHPCNFYALSDMRTACENVRVFKK